MNQDRFKFRVWDTKEVRYLPSDDSGGITQNGKFIGIDTPFREPIEFPSDFIIEQCTGLKDKNGTLIYEGDIVKFVSNSFNYILIIKWYERESGFWAAQEFCGGGTWPLSDMWDIEKEIIGNIHKKASQ